MRRTVVNSLAIISLLLCLTTLACWLRSESHVDLVGYDRSSTLPVQRTIWAITDVGTMRICRQTTLLKAGESLTTGFFHSTRPVQSNEDPLDEVKHYGELFAGFGYYTRTQTADPDYIPKHAVTWNVVALPFWAIALCLAILPAVRAIRLLSSTKRGKGRCPACGYDLRATPDRCPECGKQVSPAIAR